MKKLKMIFLGGLCSVAMLLSGCGNHKIWDTSWHFNKAYVNYGDHIEEVGIDSWSEDSTTITIRCKDGRVICTHQINIVMEESNG